MDTRIYIDGLNLYYGLFVNDKRPSLFKANPGSTQKWLNLVELCSALLPQDNILKIRYFTSHVRGTSPRARQEIYLKALKTLEPLLESTFGQFPKPYPVSLHVTSTVEPYYQKVFVDVVREKMSDVSLASYMIYDAVSTDVQHLVVVSNDSDLCAPIDIVKNKIGKTVTVFNPHLGKTSELRNIVGKKRYRVIHDDIIVKSQFPIALTGIDGRPIHRPAEW